MICYLPFYSCLFYHNFFDFQDLNVHESAENVDVESLDQLFSAGSSCFMMASPLYGCSGEVSRVVL